ncbi:hypothetical protein GCM10027293_09290 [Pontibacter aydingkolensis]
MAFGQKSFVAGYYLTHTGDTVQAHINDQNWKKNPSVIEIRNDQNSYVVQKLNVTDIRGFALSTGDAFEAFIVDLEKSSAKADEIVLLGSQPVVVRDTVFLRAIVKGNVSLFYLNDQDSQEHFFIKKGEEAPVELIYRTVPQQNGDRVGYMQVAIYKGMLTAKLTDCPEVAGKIPGVSFKLTSLKTIIENYNHCVSGTKGDFQAAEEKMTFRLAGSGGLTYTSLAIKNDPDKSISGKDYNGVSYTFGVSLISTFPRRKGRSSLLTEIMYKPLKASGTGKEVNSFSEEVYKTTTTTFDMAYVGVNILGRYIVADTKLRPYIMAGMGHNLLVSNKSRQVIYNRFYDEETTTEKKMNTDDLRKYEQSLQVGIGAEIKNILAELRFENGNGFSPVSGIKTINNSLSFRVGYMLK